MKGTLQWIVMAVFSVLIILLILQNLSIRDYYAKLSGGMKGHPGSRPAPMVQNHLKASFLFKKFSWRSWREEHLPADSPRSALKPSTSHVVSLRYFRRLGSAASAPRRRFLADSYSW